jgi:omega-hydroxy-beta-dihydromenaquinone-9 sulfotransferase
MSTSGPAELRPPYWKPKFWHGMTLRVWLGLLIRNRFAVDLRLWPIALGITAVSMVNSMLALVQLMLYGRKIARTEIREPPIFIVGHWRSGTTLLHRLLVQDERFAYPTTYDCFAPRSSLVTAGFVRRWMRFLHPMRRPMDNMPDGFDYPHEDEFALCSMGLGSPYDRAAFPNRPQGDEYIDFQNVPPAAIERWKAGLRWFLKQLTVRSGKPIVLKSPPHTARIRTLLELFPDARFVHIVRDPLAVFPSMMWTWQSVYRTHGLQRPRHEGLEEYVLQNFLRIHRAYEKQKHLIPPSNLCEVRYENLIRDPLAEMRRIYRELNLGDFEPARGSVEAYLASQKNYAANGYSVSPAMRLEIARRWGDFFRQYGYADGELDRTADTVSKSSRGNEESVHERAA